MSNFLKRKRSWNLSDAPVSAGGGVPGEEEVLVKRNKLRHFSQQTCYTCCQWQQDFKIKHKLTVHMRISSKSNDTKCAVTVVQTVQLYCVII